MEINREEMAEGEAAAVAEEEDYCLRALDFSSIHYADKVRENNYRCGGAIWGGRVGYDLKRNNRAGGRVQQASLGGGHS